MIKPELEVGELYLHIGSALVCVLLYADDNLVVLANRDYPTDKHSWTYNLPNFLAYHRKYTKPIEPAFLNCKGTVRGQNTVATDLDLSEYSGRQFEVILKEIL